MPVGWNCTSSMSITRAAGPQRERHRLAEVLVTARGAAPPDARVAAAAQHDGVGHERGAAAVVQVERERTEAGAVGDQQLRDVVLLDDGDAQLGDLRRQRVQDRPARVVARVARAPPAVGAEEPLVDATVVGAGERRNPTRPAPRRPPAPRAPRSRRPADRRAGSPRRACRRSAAATSPPGSRVPRAALIPPDASTVCASRRGRLPTTTTSAPAWWAAIAARSPAPPEPITRTFAVWVRTGTRPAMGAT